jgi:cysteine desulfurase
MWVNSEVGAIMPVREIGKLIKKHNEKREREWRKRSTGERGERPRPIYFHTDATQAANFIPCNVKENYIDLLSMSGHKIYGPKGVGVLYRREGVPLESLQRGGHHENNIRSGTLNVTGIVGLGSAVGLLDKKNQEKNNKKIAAVRDKLVAGIEKAIPNAVLNTDRQASTPAHAHFTFMGVEGESTLIALDLEGIAVSTGSACASGSLKASHVLLAMGIDKEVAHYSVRFTLGRHTGEEDIKVVLEKLPPIIERLRKMNPLYEK